MRQKLAAAAVMAVLTLSGCGSDGDGAIPPTATGSLEDLASEANCEPVIQTDADEIRQATCRNGEGKFILATFATEPGRREWLNQAKDYGGHYLVGAKWVAVGETDVVTSLRGQLGGTLEDGHSHGPASSGDGGMQTHPGHHG